MQEMWVWSLGHKDPLQKETEPTPVFCLGNPMDREAWWVTVYEVTKNWTGLSDRTTTKLAIPKRWRGSLSLSLSPVRKFLF